MNIIGMGPLEILVVLLLAFILLGPQKMMEGARLFGKASREIRRMTDELQTTINLEEEPDQDEEDPRDAVAVSFKQESVKPKADKGDEN
jgi:Sec-independent protein translocase protein TatA